MTQDRPQTVPKKLPGGMQPVTTVSRLSRPIGGGVLSHGLDQLRLPRGDAEEHQRRPVWRPAIRLPR